MRFSRFFHFFQRIRSDFYSQTSLFNLSKCIWLAITKNNVRKDIGRIKSMSYQIHASFFIVRAQFNRLKKVCTLNRIVNTNDFQYIETTANFYENASELA